MAEPKQIDYLDEDPVIHGQEWICVSFLSPEGVKNCKLRGLKFRGAFATRQEAEAHAKMIQEKLDPDFHVYVGEGFKWLPWEQDPETVENQEYHEKELNDLMKTVKENLYLKKQHETERKKKYIEQAVENNKKLNEQNRSENMRDKLRKKHTKKQQSKNPEPMKEEEVKEVMTQVNEDEKKLDEEKKEVKELAGSVQKLQEVYNKLLEKSKKQ
jgi:hypothetical protein